MCTWWASATSARSGGRAELPGGSEETANPPGIGAKEVILDAASKVLSQNPGIREVGGFHFLMLTEELLTQFVD